MFIELISSIKHEVVKILFTVQLRNKDDEQRDQEILDKMVAQMEAQQENLKTNLHNDVVIEKKIARNEPCPCGSGKKFKQCCGISGPKKGLVSGN